MDFKASAEMKAAGKPAKQGKGSLALAFKIKASGSKVEDRDEKRG